jgi:hypothetical protein
VANLVDTETLAFMPRGALMHLHGVSISLLKLIGYNSDPREFEIQHKTNNRADYRESEFNSLIGLVDDLPDCRADLNELKDRYSFDEMDIAGTPFTFRPVWKFPKDYYEPATVIEFEGETFAAPNKYHEFLTGIYGDYMTPPPQNEQKVSHGLEAWSL